MNSLYSHLLEKETPRPGPCLGAGLDPEQDETWILGTCLCTSCVRFRRVERAKMVRDLRAAGVDL